VLGEGVCAYFRTGSFEAGARLIQAIGELGGLDAHHPDVDLRHSGVTVRLITITDDDYGLSERDLELARQISAVARQARVAAAIAAGGRLVTDEHAPMWCVLADPEGNEVDVATWMSGD
jgi:pterin-4a-carbinolamine dehydratase